MNREQAVTVPALEEELSVSAATIRRDLTQLHRLGKLLKVHGGATSLGQKYVARDQSMEEKYKLNNEEKQRIARYAASLIRPTDFVYIDAGTTTELLVDCITELHAVYVTNSIMHGRKLVQKGCQTFIVGGELKQATEALVGSMAGEMLQRFHFTIGFFGTNGVSAESGFTTPDPGEAMIKRLAVRQTAKKYVLCDSSKFNVVAPIPFADFKAADIITGKIPEKQYEQYDNIMEVRK